MKIKNKITSAAALGLMLSASMTVSVFAAVKNVDLTIDTDNISGWTPGVAFFPEIELDEDDSDSIELKVDTADIMNANPTMGYTLRFTLDADSEILDEDLKVHGNGIRATYVDTVGMDGTSAEGRLLVYPYYQLPAPNPHIDFTAKTVSWEPVKYAGNYELVVSYTTKNGSDKTVHFKTKDTSKDISSYINAAADGGQIGVAVRALASDEEGYMDAKVDYASKTASWDSISGVEKYKVTIRYTNSSGMSVKKNQTVTGHSLSVSSYIMASGDGKVSVTVRGIPTGNDSKYYNIAPSDFADASGSTTSADTSDYEVDNVWDFTADYQAVVDGNFAAVANPTKAYSFGSTGIGTADGSWNRITYKWQYLVNGQPFNSGWKQIGSSWYFFDADGFMHTGWLQDNGKWYYLESKVGSTAGVMYTGTHQINGKSYVFGADGACTNK